MLAVYVPSPASASPFVPLSTIVIGANDPPSSRQLSVTDCGAPASSTTRAVILTVSVDFGTKIDCLTSRMIGATLLLTIEFAAAGVPWRTVLAPQFWPQLLF